MTHVSKAIDDAIYDYWEGSSGMDTSTVNTKVQASSTATDAALDYYYTTQANQKYKLVLSLEYGTADSIDLKIHNQGPQSLLISEDLIAQGKLVYEFTAATNQVRVRLKRKDAGGQGNLSFYLDRALLYAVRDTLYQDTVRLAKGNGYRYGFNGKEQDPEWNGIGNMYDYGFRIYDPRIAKFLSVDPLSSEFPWNSTYCYAENDVIRSIDLEGAEKYVVVRAWVDGKFKGVVFLYLPNQSSVRLHRSIDDPKTEQTMILNLNLTKSQLRRLRGDIFTRDRSNQINGLKPAVNDILFDTPTNARRDRSDASFMDQANNTIERNSLNDVETGFSADRLSTASRILTPTITTVKYNFDRNVSIELGQETLDTYKEVLEENPDYVIHVTGFTDKKGDEDYNQKLGLERAQDVKNYLVSQGIDGSRITVGSQGESEATVDENASDEERESDRKVEIQWQPKR